MTGVGLLGCGSIGREMAIAISEGKAGDAWLVCLFDIDLDMASTLASDLSVDIPLSTEMSRFLSTPGLDLVVECASPAAVRSHAEAVLARGKDLLLMSSGALTDGTLHERLADLAQRHDRRLMVPSGALGGIDAIKAVRQLLDDVTLTTTKSPRSLAGAPGFKDWESKEIAEPQVVFDGYASDAVKLFPANVNVAATLSLAGLGPDRTRVRVVADPSASQNTHEVVATGDFGVLRMRMELRPHDRNPRTSYLAIVSAIETLRAACSPGPTVGT